MASNLICLYCVQAVFLTLRGAQAVPWTFSSLTLRRPPPASVFWVTCPHEEHSCHSKYIALGTAVRITFSGIASQREESQRLGRRLGFWLRRGCQVSLAGLLTSGLGLSLGNVLLLVLRLRPRAGFLSACFLAETEDRHKVGLTSDVHHRGVTHICSVGAA